MPAQNAGLSKNNENPFRVPKDEEMFILQDEEKKKKKQVYMCMYGFIYAYKIKQKYAHTKKKLINLYMCIRLYIYTLKNYINLYLCVSTY